MSTRFVARITSEEFRRLGRGDRNKWLQHRVPSYLPVLIGEGGYLVDRLLSPIVSVSSVLSAPAHKEKKKAAGFLSRRPFWLVPCLQAALTCAPASGG
jgi:hypothetical protein